jgi:hypothetical protein
MNNWVNKVCECSLWKLCAPGATLPVPSRRESFRNSVSQNLQRTSFAPLQFRLSSPAEHGGYPAPPAQTSFGNTHKLDVKNNSTQSSIVDMLAVAAWRRMPILSARFGGRAKRNSVFYATMRNVRARRSTIFKTVTSGGGRVFLIEPNRDGYKIVQPEPKPQQPASRRSASTSEGSNPKQNEV